MSYQQHRRGHRQKCPQSKKFSPKIYLNFNARLKTLTFRPQNAVITSAELKEIQASDTQPRNFSMAILMKDVIRLLLVEDHRIHIQTKLCKYLLVHDRFRNAMTKYIKDSKAEIELCILKASRARKDSSRHQWELKAKEEAIYYERLIAFREMLLQQSEIVD